MKSWRTITSAALLALASAPALVLGSVSAPSWPRDAASPDSPGSPGSPASTAFTCTTDIALTLTFPLVMCVERQDTNAGMEGSVMPWTNNALAFPRYRNQYLYPSSAVIKVAQRAVTIESIHSRGASFSDILLLPISYDGTLSPGQEQDQWVRVYNKPDALLSTNFATNVTGLTPDFLNWNGAKTIGQISGVAMGGTNPFPAALSDFVSRPGTPQERNMLDMIFDFNAMSPASTNILVDQLMRLGGPQDPNADPMWDVTLDDMGGGCTEPQRVFGGSVFQNNNPLTTAFQIDSKAFVWVFKGKTLPPPSTIQQQIAEIIRLLVTPEGMRCTGLDLTPNGRVEDNGLKFPEGADWDPISPTVTTGKPETGEEAGDGAARQQGWVE